MSSQTCSLPLENDETIEVPLALLVNKRYSQADALKIDVTSRNDVIQLAGTITVSF